MYDNYHKKSRMQGKKLMEIKGLVIKWQRPLVPPFREAPVLEADPLQLVATVFTGKRKEDTSSLRLLSVESSGRQMIRNFSLRHKLHRLLELLYKNKNIYIFQMLFIFSSQTSFYAIHGV